MAVLTLDELLQKKDILRKRKDETFVVDVEGVGEFKFRVPDASDIDDANSYMDGKMADAYIINACAVEPIFNTEALREAYGVSTGIDVVNAIFLSGEVASISGEIVKKAGYREGLVKVVENTKNS